MMGFFTAPKLAFGPGAIEQLTGLGIRRALLVVDPALARLAPTARVVEELAKGDAAVETFEGVGIPPSRSHVEAGAARARAFRPDALVALGGGSTIDTAKGIWVAYARPELPLDRVTPLVELGLRASAQFLAIPTTGGSGAEGSWTVRLRDPAGPPISMSSRELVADWALLDPAFSCTLPPRATAEAGAMALSRALEALAGAWSNPFSDAFARAALATALPALPKAVKHPDDLDLRGALLHSAAMAGIASANSQGGVGEALAQAIGEEFPVPHGRLLAALLPYVAEFNHPVAREKYADLAPLLGMPPTLHRTSLSDRLRTAWAAAGLPRTLEAAGVPADEVRAKAPGIIERAVRTPAALGNPRVASRDELARFLIAAISGGPVTV